MISLSDKEYYLTVTNFTHRNEIFSCRITKNVFVVVVLYYKIGQNHSTKLKFLFECEILYIYCKRV